MKRLLAILLACVLIFAIAAGCTPADSGTPAAGSGGGGGGGGGTAATDDLPLVTVNYMVTGDVPVNRTMTQGLPALNELLRDRTNAELSVRWIEWTDFLAVYNLALAAQTGDLDLIGTATTWLDAWPNVQRGAFYAMSEEFIRTNAPQTWAQVPAAHWDECKFDGTIYLFPEDNFAQWINHGWMYRGDWAREAGLANGVQSWADLGTYMQYIKDTMPGVVPFNANGGVSLANSITWGWITSHSPHIGIDGLRVGLFYGESKNNPYVLSRYFLEGDGLIEFAKNQQAWDQAGFWIEDVLNNSAADMRADMRIGINGVDQHHTNTFRGESFRLEEEIPGSDMGWYWFGQENNNLVAMNITHGCMAIAAQSNHPDRAAQVYDLLRNDIDIYRILNNGIEGEQFILRDDGITFDSPPDFNHDTDGIGFNWWWGRNDNLELRSGRISWDKYLPLVDIYEAVAIPFPYGRIVFDLDPISVELDALANIWNTYIPRLAFGKFPDAEAFIAEFRGQLIAAGYEGVMEEVERQLAAVYG